MFNTMDTVAFIFARGGSKGVPRKNIRKLAGKPLIGWAIEQAKAVDSIRRVIVSTDSKEIASIAREFGAEVPFLRPNYLAQDDSPEWLSWRHGLQYLKETEGKLPAAMVSVPTTSPLRHSKDIEKCLQLYFESNIDAVITISESNRSPWFNMVKEGADGTYSLIIPPEKGLHHRQEVPSAYDITTVAYVIRPEFVFSHDHIFSGKLKEVHIPKERAIDIDTEFDFQVAESLVNAYKHFE